MPGLNSILLEGCSNNTIIMVHSGVKLVVTKGLRLVLHQYIRNQYAVRQLRQQDSRGI